MKRFMGIGQILTMPLFFASNAIYPIAVMPRVVQWFARVNPLSYQTDILRTLMLRGSASTFGLGVDFAVLIGSLVVLVTVAARIYPRVVLKLGTRRGRVRFHVFANALGASNASVPAPAAQTNGKWRDFTAPWPTNAAAAITQRRWDYARVGYRDDDDSARTGAV